ncbi:MAG: tetratricopeptide repeat protein [Candidatus Hodarchaeales archaeon]
MPAGLQRQDIRIKQLEDRVESGNMANILEEISKLEKLYKDDERESLYLNLVKCKVLLIIGEHKKNRNLANKLVSKFLKMEEFNLAFDSLMIRIQSLIKLNMKEEGLKEIARGKALLQKIGEDEESQVTLNYWKGALFLSQGNLDKALKALLDNLTYREEVNDNMDIANSLNSIGKIYHRKKEYSLALEYLLQSWFLKKKISNIKGMAESLLDMGNVFSDMANYSQSLDYYEQSKDYFNSINDYSGMERALNSIRIIYHYLSDQGSEPTDKKQ